MKYGKIVTLTLAATMLVAMAGANAFAADTWANTDTSTLSGQTSMSWNNFVDNTTPYLTSGAPITWENTFQNQYNGASQYPTLFSADTIGGWWKNIGQNAVSYRGSWPTQGSAQADSLHGWSRLTVNHRWGPTKDSNAVSVSHPQYYMET